MGSLPALRYFGSYSGCYFKPSGIMGVTHGFLASLQVFWETILLPVFRYFRIYSWFLCHSLQVFWETVLLPVFKYFGSYSRCSCQPSDVFEVLQGALASFDVFWELLMVSLPQSSGILRDGALVSFQVFWELLKVLLPAFRCFWGFARCSCQPSGILRVTHGFLASLEDEVFWGSSRCSWRS